MKSHSMHRPSFVYIVAAERHGTLYVGVTTDLVSRYNQHKEGTFSGFTSRERLNKLVYYEACDDAITALAREKTLKKWSRDWRHDLIEKSNPDWRDLYPEISR